MKILTFLTLITSSIFAQDISLRHCYNYSDTIDYSYVSCMNSNMQRIEDKIDIYRGANCPYYSSMPTSNYVRCVSNIFSAFQHDLEYRAGIIPCYNYGARLEYSYISCVNTNYSILERYFNSQL